MEEENELNLVEDRFDDLAIDDEPLDLGSDAGSYFDEEEMRSRNEEELPTSEEFIISKRYRPSKQVTDQMPTISEENDVTKATKNDSWGRTSKKNLSVPEDNSKDCSVEFKDGKATMDEYEKMYFSKENRANMLFREDDPRFHQNKFEKENSWEPSIIDLEHQPSPEIVVSPANILKANKVFTNTTSPPDNTMFLNSPLSTNAEPKNSTPKRPESVRFGQRLKPHQLEITSISSIHASSPTRAPTFAKCSPSSSSILSNATVQNSQLLQFMNNAHCKDSNALIDALEKARIGREFTKSRPKPNLRRDATISKPPPPQSSHDFEDQYRDCTRMVTACSLSSTNTSVPIRKSFVETDQKVLGSVVSVQSHRPTSRVSIVSTTSSTGSEKPNLLKINNRRLAFGAVEIGDQLGLELEMENISDRMLNVRSKLDSGTRAFEIVDNTLALIGPGQKSKLRVIFKPDKAGRYQVLLKIDVLSPQIHYSIPLWGCGGLASIRPIIEGEIENTSHNKDYILRTSKFSNISFRLQNDGERDGFLLIHIYDSNLKPVKCRITPSNAIMLRRRRECQFDIKLSSGSTFVSANETNRSSSVMSSVSTNSRRNTIGNADYVIEIKWGEELLRQRLKILSNETNQKLLIDGHDYCSILFENEEPFQAAKGFPKVVPEDRALFEASCRTTNIMVFSTRSCRQMESYRSSSSHAMNSETSILETSAFRYQTFVPDQDATFMPRK